MSTKTIETGICDYCGQVVNVADANPISQKEADREARFRCTCAGGMKARRGRDMTNAISKMFSAGCSDEFEPVTSEELLMIGSMGQFIVDRTTPAISAKLKSGDVVSMKSNAEGRITILRKHTANSSESV